MTLYESIPVRVKAWSVRELLDIVFEKNIKSLPPELYDAWVDGRINAIGKSNIDLRWEKGQTKKNCGYSDEFSDDMLVMAFDGSLSILDRRLFLNEFERVI